MNRIILAVMLILAPFSAMSQTAAAIDTNPRTGNTGNDVFTTPLNSNNEGLSIYPSTAPLPLNPPGNIPFSLSVNGDVFLGDIYCLAGDDTATVAPGAWGCVYGASINGDRVGPVAMV